MIVDADGSEHVRFDRTYAGLPVIGGDVVTHSRGGLLKGISLTLPGTLSVATRAVVRGDDAVVNAGAEFGSSFTGVPTHTLVVYARGEGAARLAWQVGFRGADANDNPVDSTYVVDARTGKVLDRWSNIETTANRPRPGGPGSGGSCPGTLSAIGSGKSLYSGNVAITTQNCGARFEMRDLTRGGGRTITMGNRTAGSGTIFSDADNT